MTNDLATTAERTFQEVMTIDPPRSTTPFERATLEFVFGQVWWRPGLSRRDRRLITVACVAVDDSPIPLRAHVGAALESGDISRAEMDEVVLQFSAYYGFAKGEALRDSAAADWPPSFKR